MFALSSAHLAAGFVTPAFVWAGLALTAIPIIIHILNRRRFRQVSWAAMDFLLQAMRKNRRRLKFEQWLLLAARCAVVAFFALALARPLACDRSALAGLAAQRLDLDVIIIDNSCTMAYQAPRGSGIKTHLDQAKLLARQLLDRITPGGESVVLITAARPATAIIASPSYDLEAARAAVDRIEQSSDAPDIGGALQLALRAAREQTHQPHRNLYLFTDATRAAWEGPQAAAIKEAAGQLPALFADRIWHYNLGLADQWNQAVLDLRPANNIVTTHFLADFTATVRGYGHGGSGQLQWKLDDSLLSGGGPVKLDVDSPPQINTDKRLSVGGAHVLTATLLSDDPLPGDNTRWHVVDVISELKVLVVEGERGLGALSGSGAFLDLALAPPADTAPGAHSDSPIAPELISDLEFPGKVLSHYRAVILTNVASVTAAEADQLQRYVQQGGALILFMGPQVNGENYNTLLEPRHLLPGKLIKAVSADMAARKVFSFNFNPQGALHPFLDPFRGVANSGLDTAQVFTYWQIEPDPGVEHVLDYAAPTEGPANAPHVGDPAITVHSVGRGRVVFVSTTANADWTSLPAKPNFVTLVHEIVYGSVGSGDQWMNLHVGDALILPGNLGLAAAPTLLDPARNPVLVEIAPDQSGYRSAPLTRPGIYALDVGGHTLPIAVNVPDYAADVRTLVPQALKRDLADIDVHLEGDALPVEAMNRDHGNDLSWWFMAAAGALAVMECYMAMHFSHYRRK